MSFNFCSRPTEQKVKVVSEKQRLQWMARASYLDLLFKDTKLENLNCFDKEANTLFKNDRPFYYITELDTGQIRFFLLGEKDCNCKLLSNNGFIYDNNLVLIRTGHKKATVLLKQHHHNRLDSVIVTGQMIVFNGIIEQDRVMK
jgi:hypothetical protein